MPDEQTERVSDFKVRLHEFRQEASKLVSSFLASIPPQPGPGAHPGKPSSDDGEIRVRVFVTTGEDSHDLIAAATVTLVGNGPVVPAESTDANGDVVFTSPGNQDSYQVTASKPGMVTPPLSEQLDQENLAEAKFSEGGTAVRFRLETPQI